ncbi:MAG: hypothetical protein H0U18_09645 [Pyrinomonadaceae bacterium]|nr:hypothetical protein [Pyrinomonadaceae bacterium]
MPDSSQGPWVAFAVLCEKTIEDKLGRLTLINMVDQINVTPQQGQSAPDEPLAVPVRLIAAIGFKGGILKGPADIKLQITKPNGEAGPSMTVSALFQGDERGTNLITDLNLTLSEEGLYWIEVLVQEQIMTRIPLRLALQRVVFGPSS